MVVGNIVINPAEETNEYWEASLRSYLKSKQQTKMSIGLKETYLMGYLKSTIILSPWTERVKTFITNLPYQIYRRRLFRLMQIIFKFLSYDIENIHVPEYVIRLRESALEIKEHLLVSLSGVKLADYLLPDDENVYDDFLAHYIQHLLTGILIMEYSNNNYLQPDLTDYRERAIESLDLETRLQEDLERKDACIQKLRDNIDDLRRKTEESNYLHTAEMNIKEQTHLKLVEAHRKLGEDLAKKGEECDSLNQKLGEIFLIKSRRIKIYLIPYLNWKRNSTR